MVAYIDIHPVNPQDRLVERVVQIIEDGGVIAYPTDSGYALGCKLGNKEGIERIHTIRQLPKSHNFTLICKDFKQLGHMVHVDNQAFRLITRLTPGPFTFIMKASREVPRLMMHPKKKTVGARIPASPLVQAILDKLGAPLLSSSLILPGKEQPEAYGWEIKEEIGHLLDAVVESEMESPQATTVIDLSEGEPVILRQGGGDASAYIA